MRKGAGGFGSKPYWESASALPHARESALRRIDSRYDEAHESLFIFKGMALAWEHGELLRVACGTKEFNGF
jgi:hypothetical protein